MAFCFLIVPMNVLIFKGSPFYVIINNPVLEDLSGIVDFSSHVAHLKRNGKKVNIPPNPREKARESGMRRNR